MIFCNTCKIEKEDSEFYKNRNKCKSCIKKYHKKYRKNNKDKFIKYKKKKYYQNNKNQTLEHNKKYYQNNKNKILENKKEYKKNRIKTDFIFKLRINISRSINLALKNQSSSKQGLSCMEFLNYDIFILKKHIEDQFEPWMNWNNQGKYIINTWDDEDQSTWTWNIDHIIPQSKLPYSSMEEENFKLCWSLDNLRPLSAKQNILDSNRR